jgi:hypothetical protein
LSLFAAGIVLLVLLIASYSRRGTWIVLGSITLSAALLFACLFLATIRDRSQVRTSLAWVASKLPLVLDRQAAERLAALLERVEIPAPCGAGQRGCSSEMAAPSRRAEREPVQTAASTASWFDTKSDPKATSQSPVAWNFDDRDVQPPVTSPWGFSISGTNVSDQALEQVQAVLKPDSSQNELELVLDMEGQPSGNGTVIPAGARFSLISDPPDVGSSKIGGAILTFRYVQAGQRRSSIFYLTPAMVARFAKRS